MALIEIDGLPGFTVLNSMVIFHGELLVITKWYTQAVHEWNKWIEKVQDMSKFTRLVECVFFPIKMDRSFHGYVSHNQMVNFHGYVNHGLFLLS